MKKVRKIIVIIFIVIVIVIGALSVFLLSKVPYDNLTAGIVSNVANPPGFMLSNAISKSGKDRTYKNLPNILQFKNGDTVDTVEEMELRKTEIVELFKENVYGEVPNYAYELSYNVIEEDKSAINGLATRKQVEITITTKLGKSSATLLMYIPNNIETAATFLALNVGGNLTVYNDDKIIATDLIDDKKVDELRGSKSDRWPVEKIINSGYIFTTIHCDDFAPNNSDYNSRWIKIFGGDSKTEEFKTIAAWSFGLSKTIDYLVTEKSVDAEKIMTVGHSRFAKASLWAAAQDERIAVAFANSSGTVGSSLSRENTGEPVSAINFLFKNWFVDKFDEYSKNEESMEFDQHMLLAAIAPRKVYLSNGTIDFWADPVGEYESLKLAASALNIYGYNSTLAKEKPGADYPIHTEYFGWHNVDRNHNIGTDNWEYYLDYVNEFLN
ncbi:MAG: hypothetical protein ACK5KQ_01920 [Anaerorhabdus sp.]